jgi:hypothetical protein
MALNDSFDDSVEVGSCAFESKVERDAASILFGARKARTAFKSMSKEESSIP